MKYEDLKILDELREKGSISEEEYQQEKAKLLNEQENAFSSTAKKPLFGMEENTYLMLMHLSQFAGWIIPFLGYILPVVMWITNKEHNANVDKHGKNIINFTISYLIYTSVAALAIILVIGVVILPILGVLIVVAIIMASIKANNGIYWKYPLTIEFLK